jgi:ketol-acid reductoisomerase
MTEPRDTRVRVYRAGDAPPDALAAETVAVLGYGYLGRSAALNLRDSGIKIRIGNRQDEYAAQASADGFDVVPLDVAASDDVVCVFLPDEVIPEVFARDVVPSLCPGSAVVFASGYSLAFGLAHPPD